MAQSGSRTQPTDSMARKTWIKRDRATDYRRFVVQKALIEKHFPCFKCTLSHRRLRCEGLITPSDHCDTYKIAISYEQNGIPEVRIKEPEIAPSIDIHMYGDGTLCLYKPSDDPWTVEDNVHEKIIPWTAEWLVFYELYLLYGKWLGPEASHDYGNKTPQRLNR